MFCHQEKTDRLSEGQVVAFATLMGNFLSGEWTKTFVRDRVDFTGWTEEEVVSYTDCMEHFLSKKWKSFFERQAGDPVPGILNTASMLPVKVLGGHDYLDDVGFQEWLKQLVLSHEKYDSRLLMPVGSRTGALLAVWRIARVYGVVAYGESILRTGPSESKLDEKADKLITRVLKQEVEGRPIGQL